MSISGRLYYRALVFKRRALRYRALFETIYRNKCRRIVEIGTYDGVHGCHMIRTASAHCKMKEWGVLRIKMARVTLR